MIINPNKVVEVIGRLKGRAQSHKHAAKQTSDQQKKQAHINAYSDLMMLHEMLADATNNPEYVKTNAAYLKAVENGFT